MTLMSRSTVIRTCACGQVKTVSKWKMDNGLSLQCRSCVSKRIAFKHGYNRTRLHGIWTGMKTRCYNANHRDYKYYGQVGVKVCDRWLDFRNFLEDMGKTYDSKLTLDRINPFGNYEPSNCRWANCATQANNKRSNYENKRKNHRNI